MPTATLLATMFRLSLRELLMLVALVASATASLKYASQLWLALVAGVTTVAFCAALIVAAVDRGQRQAFAMGFALTMIAYGATLMTGDRTVGFGGNMHSKNIEFDPWEGRLPTTRLLRYVHIAVNENRQVPMSQPFGGATTRLVEIPPREVFMPIGHCWWALLLAYVGGRFAATVYMRRTREQQLLAAESS